MFLLDELPNDHALQTFAKRYAEMDITTTAACLRILKVASVLLRELEKHFTAHGLSQARFLALIVLEREASKQLMPVEISRKMGTSKKNTTRLLSFMEQDGLIRIKDHETDKRASVVTITKKGEGALSGSMPGYYGILNRTMKNLDTKSKQTLIDLLDRLAIS